MKSAFERALERMGSSPLLDVTPEQKSRIAAIHTRYEAKIAEAKLAADAALRQCGDDAEKSGKIRKDLAFDIRALTEEREQKKEVLRREFGK